MKFYKVSVSGKLLGETFLKTGVVSDFDEKITIDKGVPPEAKLIQVRMQTVDVLDMLYATDEEGDMPEAVDVWSWADDIYIQFTREWKEQESAA